MLETFCSDLCKLKTNDTIEYAEILKKTINNNNIITANNFPRLSKLNSKKVNKPKGRTTLKNVKGLI